MRLHWQDLHAENPLDEHRKPEQENDSCKKRQPRVAVALASCDPCDTEEDREREEDDRQLADLHPDVETEQRDHDIARWQQLGKRRREAKPVDQTEAEREPVPP